SPGGSESAFAGRPNMESNPILILAFGVCALTLVVCFVAAFCALFLVFSRTGVTVEARDRGLSWGERAARGMNRFSVFLTADEFRSLRRLVFGAWAGAIGSFGLLLLLTVMIGKRM